MSHLKHLLVNGQDEAVSVNQRALIDKVLARYSGAHTLYRELLQNSDDAGATEVQIRFRTQNGEHDLPVQEHDLPNLKTREVTNIVVRNNGQTFRDEDWSRLKKIAEGNPDETKIGAFGVGFYSLFSICEEPIVSSGDSIMGFYWRGDQLFVKVAKNANGMTDLASDGVTPWTTFSMELREPAPLPEPMEFSRFLATCLGFTSHLSTLSLFFDSQLLFRVTKTVAPSRPIAIKSNLAMTSPLKILRLTSIEEIPVQLKADVSRWLLSTIVKPPKSLPSAAAAVVASSSSFASRMLSAFSSKPPASVASSVPSTPTPPTPVQAKNPLSFARATLFLRTVRGTMRVTPPSHFSAEMNRATKKALPSVTTYSLIWTGKDEFDASQGTTGNQRTNEEDDTRRVFAGLLSDLNQNGRVFIGFPTFQTSGCAASIASRFVTTVEREALDFQANYVADWNKELLFAGGVLMRSVYEEEMLAIKVLFKSSLSDEAKTRLQERALHLMRFFTFTRSTPQEIVGSLTETSFFTGTTAITLMSQLGPTPASEVRLPNPALSPFLKGVPTVPDLIATGAPKLMASLRERNIIRDISLEDVLADLAAHPLSVEEATKCFQWWMTLATNRSYDPRLLDRLKEAAMLSIKDEKGDERILPLAGFRAFRNVKTLPLECPVPDYTLPFELSRSFNLNDLMKVFRFEELSLVDFVKHVVSLRLMGRDSHIDTNITLSPPFAEKVLNTISRGWSNLAVTRQNEIVAALKQHAFMPTREGARMPGDAYLPSVVLFEDLPLVMLPSGTPIKGSLETLLLALGVRKHVELQMVFTRLLGAEGSTSSHVDVLRYLCSVRDALSSTELERLKRTAWLPREGEAKVESLPGPNGEPRRPKTVRYPASQLYEPTDTLRALGLPLLDWTSSSQRWRSGSSEAKLLAELGLQAAPTVDVILGIAALPDNFTRRARALRYFLDEYASAGFGSQYLPSTHALPFVPAIRAGQSTFATPQEVYSNEEAASLGFAILDPAYIAEATKLKLAANPTSAELISALLRDPPRDTARAKEVFTYLSTRSPYFSSNDLATLRRGQVIPIGERLVEPTSCFFKADSSLPPGLKSLFITLPDFGMAARPFLTAIGVKETPSPAEIGSMVIADPGRFLDLSGSSERYLSVLRMLAMSYQVLPSTLRSRMKMSPFFLGTRRVRSQVTAPVRTLIDDDSDEDDAADSALTYELARASDLALNDEPAAFRVFQGDVLACPQEDALETLAELLGASRISKLVSEQYRTVGEPAESRRTNELRKTLTERTALFLTERREYGKSELKHDADWIQTHCHVYEVRSIELVRVLTYGGKTKRHTQPSSACVKIAPRGSDIELYVSSDLDLDYYEIAAGLCKALVKSPRANDALLLMTVLSTSLKTLARRGYNVERIQASRRAEREAADQRMREERARAAEKAATELSSEKLSAYANQMQELFPDADPEYLVRLLMQQKTEHVINASNALLSQGDYPRRPVNSSPTKLGSADPPAYQQTRRPDNASSTAVARSAANLGPDPPLRPSSSSSSIASPALPSSKSDKGLFETFRRFGRSQTRVTEEQASIAGPSPIAGGSGNGSNGRPPQLPEHMRPTSSPGPTPTSSAAIRDNVRKAIEASKPEYGKAISSAVDKTTVRESQSTYCDSTAGSNLSYLQDIAGLRFYISQDVPNQDSFVATHQAAITRWVQIVVKPVGEVFTLDPRSINLFYDSSGPLMAFNRNGSLYLNLRYYLAWHDAEVARGELNDALISTYHTLAHEIAHNLVKPHDAEHSFYFSSICEEHFLRMAQLLARSSRR